MNKQEYEDRFENLVGMRFDTIADLEYFVKKEFNPTNKVGFGFSYINYERDFLPDWDLCGIVENDEIYCDLDIYFLYDREQHLLITEVGYEIDMKEEE